MTTAERKVRQRYPDANVVEVRAWKDDNSAGVFRTVDVYAEARQRHWLGSGATHRDAWTDAASRLPNDLEPTS